MDALILALLVAVATYILTAIMPLPLKLLVPSVALMCVVLPFLLMAVFGVFEMQQNPQNAQAIADATVVSIVERFEANLPDIIYADIAGVFVGGIAGLFIGKGNG